VINISINISLTQLIQISEKKATCFSLLEAIFRLWLKRVKCV